MPDKRYWDKKEKKEVVKPSDYFQCNRCLGTKFSYEVNHLFLSHESTKEFKQTCLCCGETFFSDKKYMEEEADRYELAEEREKRIQEAEEKKKKEEAKKQLEKDRKEMLKNNNNKKK